MRNNRVPAVHNRAVITPFNEDSKIDSKKGRVIQVSVDAALVRAYHHHVLLVNFQIRDRMEHRFDELIVGMYIFKADLRDGVRNARIVRVKGYDILHAQRRKLMKRSRAVQRFSNRTLMLPAAIQKRHDNVNALCLSCNG